MHSSSAQGELMYANVGIGVSSVGFRVRSSVWNPGSQRLSNSFPRAYPKEASSA